MNARARLSLFERLVAAERDSPRQTDERFFGPDGSPCYVWHGARDAKGYGLIKVDGRCRRVYRVAYELATGRKLGKLTAEHTCRNPSCWRPSHIVPLSRAANTAKGNRDNPRSTEKARAMLRMARNGTSPAQRIIDATNDAAARIMARGRDPVFDDGHGGVG